ncbi:protein of unknown function [Nitrospira japonica]|uniref:Uncharacterized protein n=1 Tax=Nitrospira japonica TaxID=1325564 RepID=A0A1W1I8W3_9BACT|nr:protein of unknown function [Nitrospira japonica]
MDIVSPKGWLAVLVGCRRLFRHAMTAKIEAYKAELFSQSGLVLFEPGERTEVDARNQEDGPAVGLAEFVHGQPEPTASRDVLSGHRCRALNRRMRMVCLDLYCVNRDHVAFSEFRSLKFQ